MDDFESRIDRLIEETQRLTTLVRTTADCEFHLAAQKGVGGFTVNALRCPSRLSLMNELRVSAVPAFLQFSEEGLVAGDAVLSLESIEEFLQRLFLYIHRIETTRFVSTRPATVSIRGLSFFQGVYRFSEPTIDDRQVEIDDIYHTNDGHPLMTAALAGCLSNIFQGFPTSLALFPRT